MLPPMSGPRITIGDLQPIAATEAKNRFGDLLFQVTLDGTPRLIERNGHPVAVILRYSDYVDLLRRSGGAPGS